jgi:hypothetical protein
MVTEITLMYLTRPTGVQRWRDSLLTEAVERRAGLKGGLKERNKNHYICTMKAARYNRGGQADLYKMIESYMNGGMIKKYEHGGVHEGEPDLTFIEKPKPNSPGETITQFLVEGRPVTTPEAISYYSSNMGPKEGFNEWYSKTKLNSPLAKSQKTEMIKNQITREGYIPGMTYSSGYARAQREKTPDTATQHGGNEGIEGQNREDRMRKILSGLADYNQ